jgi:leader peptidase (prepilin peptidase) / N-methyltransferase
VRDQGTVPRTAVFPLVAGFTSPDRTAASPARPMRLDPHSLTMLAWAVASVAAAIVISPVLASWTVTAPQRDLTRWWIPRRVSWPRWITFATAGLVASALTVGEHPWPVWWLWGQVGAVLAVIDVEHHRLPTRLVYPLAAGEFAILVAYAAGNAAPHQLGRAIAAAVVVGGAWFALAFAMPRGLGLGDVRVVSIAAAVLGWHSWIRVLDGQLAVLLLSLLAAAILALRNPDLRGRRMPVPMGPALILGTILVGL